MYFAAALHASVEGGGTISRSPEGLKISNASGVTLMLTSATGYRGFQKMPDKPMHEVVADAQRKLTSARRIQFNRLRERQQADHRSVFRRVSLDLGSPELSIPTDQRRAGFAKQPDPFLVALYFQYGRYLLISSSRPGSQPANLQGI